MTSPAPASAPALPGGRRPRRWRRRLLILLGVLAVLYLARAPILRGLAAVLVCEGPNVPAAYLVLLDGDRRHERAAAWYREAAGRRVLLIDRHSERLEALGLVPTRTESDRRALRAQGVPDAAVITVPADARNDWQRIRALGAWLHEHPDADVTLACERFGSRRLRLVCGRILGGDAARVHLLALRDRAYDETDWWRHKQGELAFLDEALRLSHAWVAGERMARYAVWDPDAYEAGLR